MKQNLEAKKNPQTFCVCSHKSGKQNLNYILFLFQSLILKNECIESVLSSRDIVEKIVYSIFMLLTFFLRGLMEYTLFVTCLIKTANKIVVFF